MWGEPGWGIQSAKVDLFLFEPTEELLTWTYAEQETAY